MEENQIEKFKNEFTKLNSSNKQFIIAISQAVLFAQNQYSKETTKRNK